MKEKTIRFRVSPMEKLAIEKKAKDTGLSTSAYCRNSALGKRIEWKMSDEELEAYNGLKSIYNSFQSINNSWRTGGTAKEEINEALQKLKHYLTEIEAK